MPTRSRTPFAWRRNSRGRINEKIEAELDRCRAGQRCVYETLAAGSCACLGALPRPKSGSMDLTSDTAKAPPGSTVPLNLTAKIDAGWHVYSLTIPKAFRLPIAFADNPAVASFNLYQRKPQRKFDQNLARYGNFRTGRDVPHRSAVEKRCAGGAAGVDRAGSLRSLQ